MPFTVVQAGNTLRTVNTDGGLSPAALTLPLGIALATNVTPRFARFGRYVILVNTSTKPLTIDVAGVVRPLTPDAPASAVALSDGAAGTLSGTYLSLQTYKLLDSLGNVISESDYGPAMTTPYTISNKKLHATFPLSAENVSANQVYRTTTNGAVYFAWTQVPAAVNFVENDMSDAAIGLFAAPELGTAPDLTLIAEFGGRLFGVERSQPDFLRYTTAGTMYGWNALNTVLIPRVGSDSAGITALIPRRAALGVSRHNTVVQVTGSQRSNILPTIVNGGEQAGCVSQESVAVHLDVAYWLGRDGIYRWDSEGIRCISDGLVRSWFTQDTYFNRSMFWRAFAQIDTETNTYNLFLASRLSTVHDRWISIDLNTGAFFGPHKTDAFAPTCALWVAGRNQQPFYMVGSREGFLSQTQDPRNDWDLFPIAAQATMRGDEQENPEQEKYYGELSVHVEPQVSGTLIVTPSLSSTDQPLVATAPMTAPLTAARTRIGRIGTGNSMVLDFTNAELNADVALYGYEVDPVNEVGRR